MTSSILFAGGEDIDFLSTTPYTTTSGTAPSILIDTTAGHFRSGFARYGLGVQYSVFTSGTLSIPSGLFNVSSYWFSTWIYTGSGTTGGATNALFFYDNNGLPRLKVTSAASGLPGVYTINTAGTVTQLGSNASAMFAANTLIKLDIFINYAVSGSFKMYFNGTPVYSFSGDVTTNSVTSLGSRIDMIIWFTSSGSSSLFTYSEVMVSTRDTRNLSLVTQVPTANGNTHNWDGGTASNAASNLASVAQANPQFSGTSGQIQEYEVTPTIPTGSYGVISVVQKAQATIGASGPQHFDFMVRTGSTDYTSSPDIAPTSGWSTFSYNWDTNPNTAVPWTTSDLPSSSTSFNMGLKSVT